MSDRLTEQDLTSPTPDVADPNDETVSPIGRSLRTLMLSGGLIALLVLIIARVALVDASDVARDAADRADADVSGIAQHAPRTLLDRTDPVGIADSGVAADFEAAAGVPATVDDADLSARQGLSALAEVRETGEFALFVDAQSALDRALALDPKHVDATLGQGLLALARHDFVGGRDWAEQALVLSPNHPTALGLLVDAQVELGELSAAVETAQRMVNRRPDTAAFSRIAYLRELHGDVDGAVEAMRRARDGAVPGTEPSLWTGAQLGDLLWRHGRIDDAAVAYQRVLAESPGDAAAREGLARVALSRGDVDEAMDSLTDLVAEEASVDAALTLAALHEKNGRPSEATDAIAVARAIHESDVAGGTDMELPLVRFEIEHEGKPADAQRVARARTAFERSPSIINGLDLAWVELHAGNVSEAGERIADAMASGTRDPQLSYAAGVIADANDDRCAAIEHLRAALAMQPAFSVAGADVARARIDALSAGPDCR